jgi:hypothetical protein
MEAFEKRAIGHSGKAEGRRSNPKPDQGTDFKSVPWIDEIIASLRWNELVRLPFQGFCFLSASGA